jgi:hypothetical protein
MNALGIDIGGTRVKAALLDASTGRIEGSWVSLPYARPDRTTLLEAVRSAAGTAWSTAPKLTGLCCPGMIDPATGIVTRSVIVPGLEGLDPAGLVRDSLGSPDGCTVRHFTDAHAAAIDLCFQERLSGRVLAISLGTGVGAAVIDEGLEQLILHGRSSGHFGQLDVSLNDAAPLGPDGGRGSLEGYIGWPALLRRFGTPEGVASGLTIDSEPVRALVRAIRIAHAIYKPQHVRLLGGIGLALARLGGGLHAAASHELTCVAREGWTLGFASHEFHAAAGAARLAATSMRSARPQ